MAQSTGGGSSDEEWVSGAAATSDQLGSASSEATSNQFDNIQRYVDVEVGLLKREMDALRSEMKGEISSLLATIRESEASRSVDVANLTNAVRGIPTKNFIRNWVLGGAGIVVAAAALAWQIFDTGAALPGAFADKIIEERAADAEQIEAIKSMNLNIEKLLSERQEQKGDEK